MDSAPLLRSSIPIRIGTAGWSIPRTCAASFSGEGAHLDRYAQVFSCAEINSTFYRSPRPSTYERWVAATPAHFRFSVKAPKTLTHATGSDPTRALLEAFLVEIEALGEKLGPVLFQFPPRLEFQSVRARTLLEEFRELRPNFLGAVEPRHASWFSPEAAHDLAELHLARVAADPPRVPAAALPAGTPELVYYRLHGSPRMYYSSYSAEFLAPLAATLRSLPSTTAAWCIFDNTASGAAAENALTLAEMLTHS